MVVTNYFRFFDWGSCDHSSADRTIREQYFFTNLEEGPLLVTDVLLYFWGVHKSWCQLAKKHTHASSEIRLNYFRYCTSSDSSNITICRLPRYHRLVDNSCVIQPTTIADEFCYAISGRLSRSMEEVNGFLDTQIHEFVAQVVIHTSSEVLCCCRINANSSHDFFPAFGRRRNSVLGIIRKKEKFFHLKNFIN